MKEILVFTAGRSDFGILKNLISKIKSHKSTSSNQSDTSSISSNPISDDIERII